MPQPISRNTLFYGDNLTILREHIPDQSVDLIYLDPPFNSNRNYNVLFKDDHGKQSEAQIQAFEDTWTWTEDASRLLLHMQRETDLGETMDALLKLVHRGTVGAYLVMMAGRLIELHRVLKPTGSLYLHCDPTASHYLKIILDGIFGPEQFRTEITWKRSSAHSDTKQGRQQHGRIRDIILFYTKSNAYTWTPQYTPYDQTYIDTFYRHVEPGTGRKYRLSDLTAAKGGGDTLYEWKGARPYTGRAWAYSRENMEKFDAEGRLVYSKTGMPSYKRYLDEMPGVPLQDLWDDIPPIGPQAAERLGYPTQKPLALLERIISSSSNPGDIVLDPFCGCGTAVAAAEKLGRRWVGIDITHLSIALQKYRMEDAFGLKPVRDYAVIGEPTDVSAARQLASDDRYQFQWWALSLIEARPLGGDGGKTGKKGSDKGIDGVISFIDEAAGKTKRALVQVKSGHVRAGDIRDLRGTVEREAAQIGIFITLEDPTRDMIQEASTAGFYHAPWGKDVPRIQILTIAQLLQGVTVQVPALQVTFKRAQRVEQGPAAEQHGFDLDV